MANISIWNSSRPKGISDLEWSKQLLNELLDLQIKIEKEKLNKDASTKSLFDLEKMPIKSIEIDNYPSFPRGFESGYGTTLYDTESSITSVCDRAIKKYTEIFDKCKVEHEQNLPAIENNKKIVEGIEAMMEKFGVKGSWSEWNYPTSRSRHKKEEIVSCKWKSEVSRFVPSKDNFGSIELWYKNRMSEVESWKTKKLQELDEKIKSKEKEEAEILNRRTLAQFQVKYDLDPSSDWNRVLIHLLRMDKYLRFAHFLEENRNDWNEGYHWSEVALEGFQIETELDQEIADNIQFEIDNWDNDGRCFRDCTWNYSKIRTLVDEKLLEEYFKVKSYIS